jgi:hypothetical protein
MSESRTHVTGVPNDVGGVSHARFLVNDEIGEER